MIPLEFYLLDSYCCVGSTESHYYGIFRDGVDRRNFWLAVNNESIKNHHDPHTKIPTQKSRSKDYIRKSLYMKIHTQKSTRADVAILSRLSHDSALPIDDGANLRTDSRQRFQYGG